MVAANYLFWKFVGFIYPCTHFFSGYPGCYHLPVKSVFLKRLKGLRWLEIYRTQVPISKHTHTHTDDTCTHTYTPTGTPAEARVHTAMSAHAHTHTHAHVLEPTCKNTLLHACLYTLCSYREIRSNQLPSSSKVISPVEDRPLLISDAQPPTKSPKLTSETFKELLLSFPVLLQHLDECWGKG